MSDAIGYQGYINPQTDMIVMGFDWFEVTNFEYGFLIQQSLRKMTIPTRTDLYSWARYF